MNLVNFGLTEQGFKRARYNEIVSSMESRAIVLFGVDVNLNERGPLGLIIRLTAWVASNIWQLAESVYNSSFVSTAETLTDLARIGQYIGIAPRAATFAVGEVLFTGDNGTLIPQGTQVQTEDSLIYFTTQPETVPVSGEILVPVQAIQPGALYNVPGNTIDELTNPIAGIDSVNNPDPVSGALNAETAAEFRARYRESVSRPGRATLNALRAALLDVEGVRTAKIVENDTDVVDGEGRPPHSIECYLLGGSNADIAQTILDTKAAGIKPHGSTCENVFDNSAIEKTVCFTFATVVDIYANIDVTTNSQYPADGADRIKTAVIQYIGGQDDGATIYPGLSMGDDVVYNRIISGILCQVPGIVDITLEIGVDGMTYNTQNITIGDFEVAETGTDKLVVTVP